MKSPSTMPMPPQRPSTSIRPLRIALTVACMGWLAHAGTAYAQDHSVIDYRYDMFCPGNFHHQSNYHYDPAAALKMAEYASHVYEIKSADSEPVSVSLLQKAMGNDFQNVVIFNNNGPANVQGFAQETSSKIIVIFKGSVEGEDWSDNFDNGSANFIVNGNSVEGIKVHKGFLHQAAAFEQMAKQIRLPSGQVLHSALLNSGKDVYLAGHSLGGAVATLYGAMLREYGVDKNRLSVHTFGSPSVGDKKFADRYDVFRSTGINMFRVRNEGDAVPYAAYVQTDKAAMAACAAEAGSTAAIAGLTSGPAGGAAAGGATMFKCVAKSLGSSFISHKYQHIGFLRVHTSGSWDKGGGRQVHVGDNSSILARTEDAFAGSLNVASSVGDLEGEHSMERYKGHVKENDAFIVPVNVAPSCYIERNGQKNVLEPYAVYGSKFNMDHRFATNGDYILSQPAVTSPRIVDGILDLTLNFNAPHFHSSSSDLASQFRQVNGTTLRPMSVYVMGAQGAKTFVDAVKSPSQSVVFKTGVAPEFLFERQGQAVIRLVAEMADIPFVSSSEFDRKISKEILISIDAVNVAYDRQYTRRQLVFENPLDAAWDASQRTATLKAGEKMKICVGAQDSMPGYAFQNHVLWVEPEMGGSPISLQGTNYDAASGCSEFTAPSVAGRYRFNQLQARVNGPYGEEFMGLGLINGDYYQVSGFDQPANPGGGTPGGGTGTAGTHPLNDTGITWSGHATSGNASSCDPSDPAGQDCHYGRDALATAGQLTKKGGGNGGFDFTKISNGGGELPANAAVGSSPNDWACTRDNVTGLIWEVKVNDASHLRHMGHTYSWFNTNSPDGNPGIANNGSCKDTGRCDTEKFVQDVNAGEGLCGAIDWRMPTVKELLSIVDMGRINPTIDDAVFFQNSPSSVVWSGSPSANHSNNAWRVNFDFGEINIEGRNVANHVRLVRDGQSLSLIAGRYLPIESGAVIRDTVNGLEWQRCSVGQTWNGATQQCDGTAAWYQDRLQVQQLTAAGGFRLPSLGELNTLVYCSSGQPKQFLDILDIFESCGGSYSRPTVVQTAFPNTPSLYVWSLPYSYSEYVKWGVDFGDGSTNGSPVSHGGGHVRLVRDGQ